MSGGERELRKELGRAEEYLAEENVDMDVALEREEAERAGLSRPSTTNQAKARYYENVIRNITSRERVRKQEIIALRTKRALRADAEEQRGDFHGGDHYLDDFLFRQLYVLNIQDSVQMQHTLHVKNAGSRDLGAHRDLMLEQQREQEFRAELAEYDAILARYGAQAGTAAFAWDADAIQDFEREFELQTTKDKVRSDESREISRARHWMQIHGQTKFSIAGGPGPVLSYIASEFTSVLKMKTRDFDAHGLFYGSTPSRLLNIMIESEAFHDVRDDDFLGGMTMWVAEAANSPLRETTICFQCAPDASPREIMITQILIKMFSRVMESVESAEIQQLRDQQRALHPDRPDFVVFKFCGLPNVCFAVDASQIATRVEKGQMRVVCHNKDDRLPVYTVIVTYSVYDVPSIAFCELLHTLLRVVAEYVDRKAFAALDPQLRMLQECRVATLDFKKEAPDVRKNLYLVFGTRVDAVEIGLIRMLIMESNHHLRNIPIEWTRIVADNECAMRLNLPQSAFYLSQDESMSIGFTNNTNAVESFHVWKNIRFAVREDDYSFLAIVLGMKASRLEQAVARAMQEVLLLIDLPTQIVYL